MKTFFHCNIIVLVLLFSGCMTPTEELAYDRVVCSFDSGTFIELVPGDEAYQNFLPIRLTPMTATCRVPPLSRVKLGIGWSRGVARDAEQ